MCCCGMVCCRGMPQRLTWEGARNERHGRCGGGPNAHAARQHTAAADVGIEVAAWDLAQGVAPEEAALHEARNRGRPAKVLHTS